MSNYKNFKTVVYIPAGIAVRMTPEKLESDYNFISRYLKIDKVYLETFRDVTVSPEQYLMIKRWLEGKGIEVAGGITTVNRVGQPDDRDRLFGTMCYTDPAMRTLVKEIAEYTAGLADEIILDDFFFTNCTCPSCIAAKGDKTWPEFRKELMLDVSENLIIGPARKVNPNVRITIKYPNWQESFYRTGYVPGEQRKLFDMIYTGTETRHPRYTDQRLPEYLSYALMRWVENVWPEHNGGGWIDTFSCWSTDRYLEQILLTALARPKEIMFFMWDLLVDNRFTCPAGYILEQADEILSAAGKPAGIPVYIPIDSHGEDHLAMRLGMQGIPVEMTPDFPSGSGLVILTEASLCDKDVMDKLREFVKDGGTAAVSSGFVRNCDKDAWDELSDVEVTGSKISVTRYQITDSESGFIEGQAPCLFPEINHANNASWSLLNGGDGDYHCPLFIKSPYGKGRIYTLAVPDDPQDIARIPQDAFRQIKKVLNTGGIYTEGKNVSLFRFDDGTIVIYKYVKEDNHAACVTVHSMREASCLRDKKTGKEYAFTKKDEVFDLKMQADYSTEVLIEPGIPMVFEVVY
jgi:hypothetical protein